MIQNLKNLFVHWKNMYKVHYGGFTYSTPCVARKIHTHTVSNLEHSTPSNKQLEIHEVIKLHNC